MVDRERLTPPALRVAPRLVGAVIVSEVGGARVAVRITEVEAYAGTDDPASHAYRGPSRRNAVMFGPPGHLYCYFTYGMHWCVNVVCGPVGEASAVLLRAGEVVAGEDVAHRRRPAARRPPDLARGPARLAVCLGLTGEQNGVDLCDPASSVRLDAMPGRRRAGLVTGPRVGISVATDRPWRFRAADDPTVSAFRAGTRRASRRIPGDATAD